MTGMFVTFEGVEGCGKSTQLRLLAAGLEERGIGHILTREPGGTAVGRQIRGILLDRDGPRREPLTELLLYLADRYQDIHERILPALAEGQAVLCDRYHDATLAYQGFARGIPVATIGRLAAALRILPPDLTFLLAIPPEEALQRAIRRNSEEGTGRAEGRFEAEDISFHRRVGAGYMRLARREPGRFVVLDGGREPELIARDVAEHFQRRWAGRDRRA